MSICIIAEKPSVALSIATQVGADEKKDGYREGNGYIVTWALGHLISLVSPDEYDTDGVLPIVPDQFRLCPRQIGSGKERMDDPAAIRQLNVIEECFNRSDSIIVATDAGREGELIFRYIYTWLDCQKPFKRMWISSLTSKAIKDGMDSLQDGSRYDNLYKAAKARSEADWLVGMNASRSLMQAASRGGFSLGRVQTPTLAMLCKRYRENKSFKSVPYYKLAVWITCQGTQLMAIGDRTFEREESAVSAQCSVNGALEVVQTEQKEIKLNPPLLYDLTTLQKEANQSYGYTADETLKYAQSLYEKKWITYPRTGSRYISEDVFSEIPTLIDYLSNNQKYHAITEEISYDSLNAISVDADKVTDHHALLPTGEGDGELTDHEDTLYKMICCRVLETFAPMARKESLSINLAHSEQTFKIKMESFLSKGWKRVRELLKEGKTSNANDDEDDEKVTYADTLPVLSKGSLLPIDKIEVTEHKTKPKPIYTDASLLGAMEKASDELEDKEDRAAIKECGLGTPATRAGIIETLIRRGYVERKKKQLLPTDKGLEVYDIVKDKAISDVQMTASWERALASIEQGETDVRKFSSDIEQYVEKIVSELINVTIVSGGYKSYTCPLCGAETMRIYPKLAKCMHEDCGVKLWRAVAGKNLTDKNLVELITNRKTSIIKGLTSKNGKKFNARIVLQDDGTTKFEFENDKFKKQEKKQS